MQLFVYIVIYGRYYFDNCTKKNELYGLANVLYYLNFFFFFTVIITNIFFFQFYYCKYTIYTPYCFIVLNQWPLLW